MSKKKKLPKVNELCSRSFTDYQASMNEDDEHVGILEGVPIVFEQSTDIAGLFEETIASGAISEEVLRDVAHYYNHDLNTKPHARTRNKTMTLEILNDGVHMRSFLNLDRMDSKDYYLAVRDGLIDGMSFMFRVDADEWTGLDTDYPKRRVLKIGYVQEISGVNYPAYAGTSINARSDLLLDSDKKALDSARASMLDSVDHQKDDEKRLLELEKAKNENRTKGGI